MIFRLSNFFTFIFPSPWYSYASTKRLSMILATFLTTFPELLLSVFVIIAIFQNRQGIHSHFNSLYIGPITVVHVVDAFSNLIIIVQILFDIIHWQILRSIHYELCRICKLQILPSFTLLCRCCYHICSRISLINCIWYMGNLWQIMDRLSHFSQLCLQLFYVTKRLWIRYWLIVPKSHHFSWISPLFNFKRYFNCRMDGKRNDRGKKQIMGSNRLFSMKQIKDLNKTFCTYSELNLFYGSFQSLLQLATDTKQKLILCK